MLGLPKVQCPVCGERFPATDTTICPTVGCTYVHRQPPIYQLRPDPNEEAWRERE